MSRPWPRILEDIGAVEILLISIIIIRNFTIINMSIFKMSTVIKLVSVCMALRVFVDIFTDIDLIFY